MRYRFVRATVTRFMPGEEMADALGAAEPREGRHPHDVHVPGGEHRDGAGRRRGRRALPPPVRPARGARRLGHRGLREADAPRPRARRRRDARAAPDAGRAVDGARAAPVHRHGVRVLRRADARPTGASPRRSSSGRASAHPVPVPDAAGRGRPASPTARRSGWSRARTESTRTWRSTTAAVSGRPSRSSRSRSRGQAAAASPWPRTTSGCSRASSGARPPPASNATPTRSRCSTGSARRINVGWPRTATASAC